jgi:ATP-dependent DNA helicase RecG
MEKAGRGSVLMVQQCRESGLLEPFWKSDPQLGVTVTFTAPETAQQDTPHVTQQDPQQDTPHGRRLLEAVGGEKSRAELMQTLHIRDRVHFAVSYLHPTLELGALEMTQPDKPRSVNQRYCLTPLGKTIRARSIGGDS